MLIHKTQEVMSMYYKYYIYVWLYSTVPAIRLNLECPDFKTSYNMFVLFLVSCSLSSSGFLSVSELHHNSGPHHSLGGPGPRREE